MQYDEDNEQFPPLEGNNPGIPAVICVVAFIAVIVVIALFA